MDKERIENAVREILLAVGEDPDRPGLLETPKRVANMYEEIFRNYEAIKVLGKDNIKIKDEKVYKNDILYLDEDIYVSVKNKNKDKIDVNYSLFDEGKYSSGDVVGYVSVSLNGNVIRKENIYVKKEEVKEHVSWWTKFLRWLGW